MGKAPTYRKPAIRKALTESGGIIVHAAQMLGCSPTTIYRAIERWPDLKEDAEKASVRLVDEAKAALMRGIQDGVPAAYIFALKTKGKSEGFVERQEITGADGERIQVILNPITPGDGDAEG